MAARSAFRIMSRPFAWALLALMLAAAGGLYWLGTQHALQWLARHAVAYTGDRLALDGVRGSLYERIRVARAAWRDESGLDIEARDVALRWRPALLLRGNLRITELAVAELRAATADTHPDKPPQPPGTLRLPLSVNLENAHAGRIELAPDQVVQDLRFRLRAGADASTFELLSVAARGWRASGTLRVESAGPFGARGRFALEGNVLGEPLAVSLAVGGNLEALKLEASTAARGAAVSASALLHPFSALPLEKLTLDAQDVDLAQWNEALPGTKIELAAAAGMIGGGRLRGTVRLLNAAFGPADAGRLPVSRASFAFDQRERVWVLSDLDFGIGADGRMRGSGTVEGTRAHFDLVLAGIAGAALHTRLEPLSVSGRAAVTADPDAQRITAALEAAGARLDLAATHAGQAVTVERGELEAEDARLEFTGRAALTGDRAFSVDARFRGLDPARFIDAPRGHLNGSVSARGALAPWWRVQARIALAESRLRGRTLSASADLETGARQLFAGEARADYGGNRIAVAGRFGNAGDRLQWSLDAPDLEAVDAGLAGNVKARGTLEGSVEQPALAFELSARALAAGGLGAGAADARGSMEAGPDGALRVDAKISGISAPGPHLDALTLAIEGTRARHGISAAVRGREIDAALRAAGGLEDTWRWNGTLTALDVRGRVPVSLTAPARVTAAPGLIAVESLQADALGGRLGPASVRIADGRVTTSGSFSGLAAEALLALAPQAGVESRSLTLGGRWDFTLAEAGNGVAQLHRESGDLGLTAEKDFLLGLERLALDVTAQDNKVEAALDVRTADAGTLAARAATRLERREGAWAITRGAPLDGTLTLDMKSLAWVRAFAPRLDRIDGRAAARVEIGGTAGAPVINGTASADGVEVRALDPGVQLTGGTLRASFDGRTLTIGKLAFQAGDGTIEADGSGDLSAGLGSFEVSARADRARILASPQLTVIITGAGRAGLRDAKLALEGKFKLDQGRYDLGSERKPGLGDDVVVTGRTPPPAPAARPLRVALDATIDLNDKLAVRGYGLDVVLGGSLQLTAREDRLHALGTIRTVRGEYLAFGQPLAIQRGALSFSGPLGNPGIDLRAARKMKTVEVGVEVTGSLARPVVKLVSDPAMSDSDKLGWLLLGRDPQTASGAELAILQAAALTSGTRGAAPMQRQIAEGLGLDEFGISQDAESRLGVLALGKRITDRVTVRIEQGLDSTTGSLVKIEYLLTERWRLEGTAGAQNAADILFTLRFD